MTRRLLLALLVLLFLVPVAAWAQGPRYTFAELGWQRLDPDGEGSTKNGFYGAASGSSRRFHFFGEYARLDPSTWEVGAGWHGIFGQKADLVAELSWIDDPIGDGFNLALGVRWMVAEYFELNGFVNWSDLDLTNRGSVEFNGIYFLEGWFGVGAGYEAGEEFDVGRIFVRFPFGRN